MRMSVIHAGKFCPDLLCPDRHHQKSQWRIIEPVIFLISLAFYLIVEREIAAEECRP